MKIAICDDEVVQLNLVQNYCEAWGKKVGEGLEIQTFESAENFLFHYEDDKDIDVLLLDIEMRELNGMDLAKKLRGIGEKMKIVFITGNSEYVFEGYAVEALDYIVKPIKEEKLWRVLERVQETMDKKAPVLLIQSNGSVHKVNINTICVIESIKHDTILHMGQGQLLCKRGISDLELEVDAKQFYRCHRSYLVNLSKIISISKKEVSIEGGLSIPIARGKWEGLNKAYLDFYRGVLCSS